jgi:hypothetical protein
MALRLGIRRLGEIAAKFMTIDEMAEAAEEAARQSGDPGVRGVIMGRPSRQRGQLLQFTNIAAGLGPARCATGDGVTVKCMYFR